MFSHLLIKYLPCFVFKKRTQKVPLIRPMEKVQWDGVTVDPASLGPDKMMISRNLI